MTPAMPLPINRVDPHPYNPRRDVGDVTELADSIRAHGVRQNLLVVPQQTCQCNPRATAGWMNTIELGEPYDVWDERCGACSAPRRFTVVIGHRRLAAARLAGQETIPAVIDYDLDSAGQLELMLLENLQRVDLTPVEEAKGYQDLLDLGHTTAHIAKTTGRSTGTITGRLKLLKMAPAAQEAVHTRQATLEDAAALQWVTDNAEKRHAKLVEKATEAIGTKNFAWELKNARQAVEKAITKSEREQLVENCGMKRVKTLGDSYKYVQRIWERDPDRILSALKPYKRKKDHVIHLDAWGDVTIYRERTTDDVIREAGQKRTQELRAEIAEQEAEDFNTADQLRSEFLRGLLGRTRLLTAWSDSILDAIAPLAATASLHPDMGRVRTILAPELEPLPWTHPDVVRGILKETCPDADPAALLLLAYASQVKTWKSPELRPLYHLLELMGYETSDTERAYLERDIPCEKCQHPTADHDLDDGTCYGHGTCPCSKDEDGES